ncbi:MAG: Gfo/Idh/MocA family oxidoreductase [Acidobacteriota bacterium]
MISDSKRPWRVAVLGLGHWYSAYGLARALPEYPRAELVAAAWHDQAQLDAFTTAFGVRGYRDYAELLERERVDIVHIAAPVSELMDITLLAARAGKHILLGKPMAMTVEQADRMVDAVESAGVSCFPLQGIMRLRLADVKERVSAGAIGDLAVIHQTSRWSIAEDGYNSGRPGWFADPKYVPGGALIDEGIYWMDLIAWLAGSDVVEVDARTANLVHKDIAVEDWGMATFTLANGVIATLEASWTINAPRKTAPSPKHNSIVRLELVGTRGEIIDQWFRDPGRAALAAGASDWVFERQSAERFAAAAPFPLDHFIDSLEQVRPPAASIRDARRTLAVAMAAYQSARERKPVRL